MIKSPSFLNRVNQWVNKRSLNALDKAYSRAKIIKMIEDQHFEEQKKSLERAKGKSVFDYFQSLLNRELLQIRWSISQFNLGNFYHPLNQIEQSSSQENEVLQKLNFIELIIGKYRKISDEIVMANSVASPPKTLPINSASPTVQSDSFVPYSIYFSSFISFI